MSRTILILLLLTLFTGCGGGPKARYNEVTLVKTSGTVTLDGSPLANAVVTFHDLTDDTMSYGLTDSSGRYTLSFDSQMTGVKPGKKRIEVSTTRRILGLNSDEEADPDAKRKEDVPACYNKSSQLEFEISTSTTQVNLDLKSDCSTKAPS